MFDRIAPRYDLLNRLLSAGVDRTWRRAAVDELGAASDVLDLCTGTADLLLEALGREPGRCGVGVDLSFEMLACGRRKLRAGGLEPRAALVAGDAERLPLPDACFDGALVGFGIRNVADPEAALREIHRTLKAGGRLVVLEFSQPPGVFGFLYRLYSRHVLPLLGGLISGDRSAYAYLPASIARFPEPTGFARLLERAGFGQIAQRSLSRGIVHLHRGTKAA
jgi:demethylmenaquinone methyltransferase/2-methoxy-6-polyprenyl-1,4-benzoquinol methylase